MQASPPPPNEAAVTQDSRGIHYRQKVIDGEYSLPSRFVSIWKKKLDMNEAELTRTLESLKVGYVLPWNVASAVHGKAGYGRMGRAIFTKLITLHLEKKISINFASDASRLGMDCIETGFMGIMGFTIEEPGALDQDADALCEIHTIQWSRQKGRTVSSKTIKHCWSSIGLDERVIDEKLTYYYRSDLRKRHHDTIERKTKPSASKKARVEQETPEERILGIANAKNKAESLANKAAATVLRANAAELSAQAIQMQVGIDLMRAEIDKHGAETKAMFTKAAVLLVDAEIEKEKVVAEKKRSEAAQLVHEANALDARFTDTNIYAKLLTLCRESDFIQMRIGIMHRRADEIDATSSLLMMAQGV
jgi:hypothetical protein